MDVIFETSNGRQFTVEIWFFATVLEMKENIEKLHGIPVSKQTLVFNGQIMTDDHDTEFYNILQGSRIQLTVDDGSVKPVKSEDPAPIHLLIKIPISKRQFTLEVKPNDTIGRLKERIHELESIQVARFELYLGIIELQNNRTLAEYQISDGSELNVSMKPFLLATASGNGLKKLKLIVLLQCGMRVPVEVNPADNAGELRKELQRLQKHLHFRLPPEGYFFIYNQNVMDEDCSFRWHDVRQGGTIEIFNGNVTGGS